jgi:serine/threonine-protein kinase
MLISAVGLIDPSDPRYQNDKALMQSDLRADSKGQLIEKALALLLDTKSLAKNYDVLKDKLLSKSGSYITTVVRESEPRMGKDGLMSITTQAVVNVKAVQKSLNQMSREERIELSRAPHRRARRWRRIFSRNASSRSDFAPGPKASPALTRAPIR